MRKAHGFLFAILALVLSAAIVSAQEFGQGKRRTLFEGGKVETTDLPKGRAMITGGERLMPPGGRSPWHTDAGAKLLYLVEGTLAAEGLGGKSLMTCGPGPKLCLFSSQKNLWFFRNAGQGPLKFVVIGIDGADFPTIHEEVGQVTGISGNRVTLAVGDLRTSDLAAPRREVTITVNAPGPIAVGENVVTVGHNEKDHKAESLVKLTKRWQ